MRPIYLDATPLIALGTIGELDHLTNFDGSLIVLPEVQREVTTEPARTNLDRLLDRPRVLTEAQIDDRMDEQAMEILGETTVTGDVRLVGVVLEHTGNEEPVAIVSDDRRVRTVARGLGATVTGTIGVIVRAVEEGLGDKAAKDLLRQVDQNGPHMTGELRETADRLIEAAAE